MSVLTNISIRRKQTLIIMLTSSAVLLLACAAFTAYEALFFRQNMVEALTSTAQIVGDNTAGALDFDDPTAATEALAGLQSQHQIIGAAIYKKDGELFAKYDRVNDGIVFSPTAPGPEEHKFEARRLILSRPILHNGETVGFIYLESDMQELYSRLENYAGIVGMVFVAALLLALILSNWLQRLISGPILQLLQLTRAVAVDKNYSVRAAKQSQDELGQLVDGFNEMLGQIQLRDADLQVARNLLERRVEERTKELAKANDSLLELQSLYQSLVEHLPAGVFRKDLSGRYVFVNSLFCRLKGRGADVVLGKTPRELAAYEATLTGTSPSEISLQQMMASRGADHHETMIQTGSPIELEEAYPHLDGTTQYFQAIKSPVFAADKKIIGTQGILFDITGRKRAEAELAYERDLLRTLLENSPDQIYFKDLQSRFIKSSRAQAQNFGVSSADELIGKMDSDFFSDEHARPAFLDEQEIIRTGRPLIGKIEKEVLKDGRVSWVIASKMPFRNNAGEIIGTFGISKDITAMKEAEARLEEAHKQLLENSRHAGMAEVATGVLHNVGNVLNSVNVSTTLLADQVKKSKLDSVSRVAALLQENAADLGTFMMQDPRGRRIPAFLVELAKHLTAEQSSALVELTELHKNIEHIKDIVSMQQNFAKASGMTERIMIGELIDDSLRINELALRRHNVKLIREYQTPLPEITVDRHKVMQIMINLVRNAKYACDDSGTENKQITVRLSHAGGRITIAVADNGVGIPPENLNRIFNHGFTTRKNGHGFGLHSGALAAKEIGGVLTAQSEGPGKGASFVLELPLLPPEKI